LSGYSGSLCPDIPDYEPDSPDITWNFTRRLFLVVGLILMAFVVSLEHNYHILNFKIKTNSSSKFKTPLFISLLRGHVFVIRFASSFLAPAHMLDNMVRYICALSSTTKTN
jgi:tetrahydromethanopterin S-methyltransferase subunit E